MARRLSILILALGFVGVVGIPSALAQTDAFLFIDGIPGDSVDSQHRDWIDLTSLNQNFEPGVGCAFTVAKGFDSAGPLLWAAAAGGDTFPEMRIEIWGRGVRPRQGWRRGAGGPGAGWPGARTG